VSAAEPPVSGAEPPVSGADPPSPAAARERLGRAQAELLAALVAGGDPPAGFDAGRLRVQADALVAKRRRVVAALWPQLPAALGDRYAGLFADYARSNPRPTAGARADGRAFAAALVRAGELPARELPAGLRPARVRGALRAGWRRAR
jgi:hypothetical protein